MQLIVCRLARTLGSHYLMTSRGFFVKIRQIFNVTIADRFLNPRQLSNRGRYRYRSYFDTDSDTDSEMGK